MIKERQTHSGQVLYIIEEGKVLYLFRIRKTGKIIMIKNNIYKKNLKYGTKFVKVS